MYESCVGICKQDVRTICESFANMRGLPNYPHGIIFTFWEQYVSLRFYLTLAVVAALTAIFLILAILLLNLIAAFLVVRYNVISVKKFNKHPWRLFEHTQVIPFQLPPPCNGDLAFISTNGAYPFQ